MSPTSISTNAIEIFIAYVHEDKAMRNELAKHLSSMRRQGLITALHDREIKEREEWTHEIDSHLDTAQIILLLISSDFIASDYCYSAEMKRALERHEAGETHVIPVILRPADWRGVPFGKLPVLPKNGKPITSWSNHDEAFANVVRGIRNVLEELTTWSPSSPLPLTSAALADISTEPVFPPFWNVPHPRNSLFTGRENLLKDLYDALIKNKAGSLALSGSNGIGKTQIAVEYAYRYNRNYQAVLWTRASSRITLASDFVAIASLLDLPEKEPIVHTILTLQFASTISQVFSKLWEIWKRQKLSMNEHWQLSKQLTAQTTLMLPRLLTI